jgi:hypothetical protein
MPRPLLNSDTFWTKVERRGQDECWPWIGKTKSAQGYGRLDFGGKEGVYAPRVAYLIAHPNSITLRSPTDLSIPEFIRHTCDNPPCCNPKHLILGSHADNIKDKVARGRQVKWGGGIGSPRAKLSAEDVRIIRLHKKAGATIKALALLYEVSRSVISHCLYGLSYQDVI